MILGRSAVPGRGSIPGCGLIRPAQCRGMAPYREGAAAAPSAAAELLQLQMKKLQLKELLLMQLVLDRQAAAERADCVSGVILDKKQA